MAEMTSDRQCSKPSSSQLDTTDKPFKKAKYEWQIKGRRRDRNVNSLTLNRKKCSNKKDEQSVSSVTALSIGKQEPKNPLTIETDCLDEIEPTSQLTATNMNKTMSIQPIHSAQASYLPLSKSSPSQSLPQTKSVSQHQSPLFFPSDVAAQCVDEFFTTLNRNNYNLRKWQTKQIAKAIIDNAINKVLEDMGFTPLPSDSFEFNLADPIPPDNDITPQNIESKGVSEAIKQQGLQRRSQSWDVQQVQEERLSCPPCNTRCTCLLRWRSTCDTHDQNPQELATNEDTGANKKNNSLPVPEQDTVLDAALSFAISEKGLGSFTQ